MIEEKRILAIDFGEKRIGIAITDPLNIFAYPLVTLENNSKFFIDLKKIIDEYHVVKIIIGNPVKENGEESKISKLVYEFKDEVFKICSLPIELIDERYSSEIAKQRVIETVLSKKKRRDKSLLDKNSAAVILEDYLRSTVVKRN